MRFYTVVLSVCPSPSCNFSFLFTLFREFDGIGDVDVDLYIDMSFLDVCITKLL